MAATAAPGGLRAGAARAEITPDPAMLNWVHRAPYEGVVDPLFVRVLVLDDGATAAAIITWDLLDVWGSGAAAVRAAVAAATGIPAGHILINAMHNHSGPRAPFVAAEQLPRWQERLGYLLDDPVFRDWSAALPATCARVAAEARAASRPVELLLGRANVGEWLFNRRPRKPDGRVVTMMRPVDPYALPDALQYGPVDPTLTVILAREPGQSSVGVLLHLACHAVAVYPEHRGLSADWPGPVCQWVGSATQAEALVLQGCCGDLVPARRGLAEREAMARGLIERALGAVGKSAPLPPGPLRVASAEVGLPLRPEVRAASGLATVPAEVQVIACGPLALVALPGEPLLGVGQAIAAASPLPHTLVLGYSNGFGVSYVGLPGERARGGYEAETGAGADECGAILVATATRLLGQVAE